MDVYPTFNTVSTLTAANKIIANKRRDITILKNKKYKKKIRFTVSHNK